MKPLSKQELFKEVKKVRDMMSNFLPNSLKISDSQIKKNIEKKYEFYKVSVEVTSKKYENTVDFSEYVKNSGEQVFSLTRDAITGISDKEKFGEIVKNLNTKEKAQHFANKAAEEIIKADYKELSEAILDFNKMPEYMQKNPNFIFKGINRNAIKNESTLSKSTQKYLDENTTLFETLSCLAGDMLGFNATPFSMLTEGSLLNISYEESSELQSHIMALNLKAINNKEKSTEDKMLTQVYTSLESLNYETNKDFLNLAEKVVERDIRNVSELKPENPKQSLKNAILRGGNLVRKSDEEIKAMNEEFNALESVVLEQRFNDKEHSNPLNKEEFVKYTQYKNPDFSERKNVEEFADNFRKIQEEETRKRAEAREAEIKNAQKSIIDDAVKATTEYEKLSGVSKFFSRLLPNSWTKAGRLRNQINETKEYIESHDLTEEFNNALNEAKGIKEEPAKDKEEPNKEKEVVRTQLDLSERLNEGPNSLKENFEKEKGLEATITNEKENTFDDFEIIDESQIK